MELGVDELGACIGFVVQEQTYLAALAWPRTP
jgi:hypothetical protein